MNRIFLILFLVMSVSTYAQKLKDRIQGDWVCTKILDSNGQPTIGKFGESNEFLKFSFIKNSYSISESPFDKGIEIPIVFKNENSFDWLPNAVYNVPERIYVVKKLNEKQLILSTKAENGDTIFYYFINQNQFSNNLKDNIVDLGIILIKHIRLSKKNANNINKTYEYRTTNDSVFLSPSPTFEYPQGGSFGQIFSYYLNLPKTFKLDEISDELVLDFDISKNGAENFRIAKGLSNEIDTEVIRVMEKLHKSWKPIVTNKIPLTTTTRLHLFFYMTISEIKLSFKN
jgi:hypothetical protein